MGQVLSAATTRRISGSGNGGSGSRHAGGEGSRNKQEMPYRYPPKSGGAYFANHFIMGGEKFDSPQPESFLFGENSDLNFLGGQPVPFPYPPPQANEPTKTLRSLVNIRRDSLHFVLVPTSPTSGIPSSTLATPSLSKGTPEEYEEGETTADEEDNTLEEDNSQEDKENNENEEDEEDDEEADETTNVRKKKNKTGPGENSDSVHNSKKKARARRKKRYNIQFTFDADVKCSVTIYYFCSEEITTQACTYSPIKPEICSDTYYYNRGAGQIFSQPTHIFRPGIHAEDLLQHSASDIDVMYPVVIQMVALEHSSHGDAGSPRQSHATVATVDVTSDGNGYMLKPLKQKLFVDGLSYLLQEIYGLENKCVDEYDDTEDNNSINGGLGKSSRTSYDDDDLDDSGADCVVCMCEIRDTIILPCRHLCLCYTCAESLRFQANNCPICRAPFRALLQLRAVQKISHAAHPALAGADPPPGLEGVPPGYMNASLVEALNGPSPAALAAAAAVNAAPSPLPPAMSLTSSSAHASSSHGRRNRSKKQRSSSAVVNSGASCSSNNKPGSKRNLDLDNYMERSLSLRTEIPEDESALRAAVPPEALPATVLELGELQKLGSEQRRGQPDKSKKDKYDVRDVVPRKIKISKGSSLSGSKSDDLVDEELAKMAEAESLNELAPNNDRRRKDQELPIKVELSDEDHEAQESFDHNIDDVNNPDSDSEDGKEDEEDDEAIIVALPMVSSSSGQLGKVSPTLPGTPISTTSSSARSSQDSSASSTKQLLPKPSTVISVSSTGTTSVSVDSTPLTFPTPVTIVPTSAATIVNVASTEIYEETC